MENIDWKNLPFGYFKTDYNVRCYYRNGKWGELEACSSEYISIHMAATALHYGQEAFEGMKAYRGKDGKVRLFRWVDNARRFQDSANGIMMAPVPEELFFAAIEKAVRMNARFIPPYGMGASLYIRPLLIGSGPQVGVRPATEYLFMVFVTPVGPYFKEGFNPVNVELVHDYDRAAPQGTGHIKVGGNYAASLVPASRAAAEGYSSVLFLDAKEKKYIDEAGPANFFGIKNNTYVTPKSHTILPSITNKSIETIATDIGLKVERRPVPLDELETFEEVGACGTAAIISPIGKIVDRESKKVYQYGEQSGPISTKIYQTLRGIQEGEVKDIHDWTTVIEGI
ncbi:MAG: branched-chain amino acid aminotransferase [Bacteroidales bacterium]|nr:branched-chain amino acid aminotransferase [Bacteroidales bacterium]MDD3701785.1 branched-chain amino acid aminotransferase [Bacteroidales bacterium]MDY0369769.1 branched-chain amino acid aminotransferase [Bacteroidales bacterium]